MSVKGSATTRVQDRRLEDRRPGKPDGGGVGPAIAYLGPSLSREEAEGLLRAGFRPPVRRGDLLGVRAGCVVIIDGEFGQQLSVSPKEILRLLDRGTRVIGGASMGALRAAELSAYGMEGVGWVFDAYMSGEIQGDDEVAVMYSPLDYRPLTVPLVDVRHWLGRLEAAGRIDRRTARRLLRAAGDVFFADRTVERLRRCWAGIGGGHRFDGLLARSPGGIPSIKAADARLVLTRVRGGRRSSTGP